MPRPLFVIVALPLACIAFAAPAPEPFVTGWGIPLDPSRDCKIHRNDGLLTIEMPGTEHDYDPIRKQFNAPRLLREIDGQFDVQVRVRIDCRPSAQSTIKDQPSCVSAGILLIYPDTVCLTCDRFEFGFSQPAIGRVGGAFASRLLLPRRDSAARKGSGEEAFFTMKNFWYREQSPTGVWDHESLTLTQTLYDPGWLGWPLPRKTNHAYLRLEQSDKRLTYFISSDGENWSYLVHGSHPPTKLKLGLTAYSTSTEQAKVRFDQLKLTRPNEKERLNVHLPSVPRSM